MNRLELDWRPLALVPALALLALPLVGSPATWLTLTVAGLAMGMIIFIIASGLTLVFGLMDVLNFGHGVFIALGAFMATTVLGAMGAWTGSPELWRNLVAVGLAMGVAMAVAAALGLAFERFIVRPVYGQHLKQILITMGGMIMGEELIKVIWGPQQIALPLPEALRGARPEIIHAHMQRRFGDFLGRPEIQGPFFVYPLSLSLAEQMSAPRIALLGDAAHGVHPIAGQGLNLGLKDAAALAQVLLEAARNGEDIGSETVLERYGAWRRFDNVMLALATDGFNRLFSNAHPLLRRVRGAGLALVNRVAPARSFFMREAGGATGDLPRLLRGQALS
jgi:hypothetical protein